MSTFEKEYDISFEDIGPNLKLTNIALMRYLVDIAGLHSESLGYGISTSDITNVGFLLTGWKVKVLKRPHLLDKIKIITWPETFSHSLSTRNFEVYLDNKIVALGTSKWILVNPKDHSIGNLDEGLTSAFIPENKSVFDTPIPKLKIPNNIDKSYSYTIKRRDIDSYNHVNNLKYLEFSLDLLDETDAINEEAFSEIIVNYKHESILGDIVNCSYTKTDSDECTIFVQNQDCSKIHSIIKLKK